MKIKIEINVNALELSVFFFYLFNQFVIESNTIKQVACSLNSKGNGKEKMNMEDLQLVSKFFSKIKN